MFFFCTGYYCLVLGGKRILTNIQNGQPKFANLEAKYILFNLDDHQILKIYSIGVCE